MDLVEMDRRGTTMVSFLVAVAMWYVIFTEPPFGFWPSMTVATLVLLLISVFSLKSQRQMLRVTSDGILLGMVSGVLLYLFFWGGFQLSKTFLPAVLSDAGDVYSYGHGFETAIVAVLLLFPIAPAEEMYWRGLLQTELRKSQGTWIALLLTSAVYGMIHIVTLNLSLILVAFLGGLLWGSLLQRTGSLVPGILSHIVFVELVFVLLPLS